MRISLWFVRVAVFTVIITTSPGYAKVEIALRIPATPSYISPYIFGNNMIGYDLTHQNQAGFVAYSNYGAGIWDPLKNRSVPEVINLARSSGMNAIRFPGGNGSSFYNWKKTIGPRRERQKFLYGLDEFLKTCEEIGAEVIFTIPYYTGASQDAADLVEYLNAPDDGNNPNGGIDWARKRAGNGHTSPYEVRFFELGNEVYQGVPKKGIPGADPEQYARDYMKYKRAMKAVDASILLGAVINSTQTKGISQWNERLFKIAGDSIDFLIEHTYRPWYTSNDEKVNPDTLFADTLAGLDEVDMYYKNLSRHFEMVTGRKNVPIAVTEYNGGFVQDNPIPFRHSLGTALFNAGLIQIFMKPENNIWMANYWQFVNSYWGMIKNDKFMEGEGTYIKRPNFYVFEMFHKYFGTELIDVIISDSKDISVSASRSKDGKIIYVTVLNKNLYEDIEATLLLKEIKPVKNVNVWTLNGPSVWATNEKDPDNVTIRHKSIEIKDEREVHYKFPAHSLTSLAFRL